MFADCIALGSPVDCGILRSAEAFYSSRALSLQARLLPGKMGEAAGC
jgi:hypothetical protein